MEATLRDSIHSLVQLEHQHEALARSVLKEPRIISKQFSVFESASRLRESSSVERPPKQFEH